MAILSSLQYPPASCVTLWGQRNPPRRSRLGMPSLGGGFHGGRGLVLRRKPPAAARGVVAVSHGVELMVDDESHALGDTPAQGWNCGPSAHRHPLSPPPTSPERPRLPKAESREEVPTLPWPTFDSQTSSGPTPSRPAPVAAAPSVVRGPTQPAAQPELTSSGVELLGRYRYDLENDSWWWSDELYRMYGFSPGEVVPSGSILLAHTHPEDVEPAAALISTAVMHGGQYSLRHRIVDKAHRVRTVVSIGEALTDIHGTVIGLAGFVSDLTQYEQVSVTEAVTRRMARRSVIEQGKGALIARYGCDPNVAFALLKWRSQETNIKIHDVASRLVDELGSPSGRLRSAAFDGFKAELVAVRL